MRIKRKVHKRRVYQNKGILIHPPSYIQRIVTISRPFSICIYDTIHSMHREAHLYRQPCQALYVHPFFVPSV